jgi:hypothetical protein
MQVLAAVERQGGIDAILIHVADEKAVSGERSPYDDLLRRRVRSGVRTSACSARYRLQWSSQSETALRRSGSPVAVRCL